MKTITICSSASFYQHVNQIADELESMGYRVLVPHNAKLMKKTGDYDTDKTKTWYNNPSDFHKKTDYIDRHIREIEKADVVLIVNDEKRNIPGYIGGNVMIEMAIAYYLKKPIYVLYDVPQENQVYEEVYGLGCKILKGDLGLLSEKV